MNVNVTVELEIMCQHHVTTGCFYLVHILSSTNNLTDLLRVRFRVSESCGLQVINY